MRFGRTGNMGDAKGEFTYTKEKGIHGYIDMGGIRGLFAYSKSSGMVGTVDVSSSFGMDVLAEASAPVLLPVEQPIEKPVEKRNEAEIPWELISHEEIIPLPVSVKDTIPFPLAEEKKIGIAEVIDIETLKESRAEAESLKKAKEEKKQAASENGGYTYFGDHGGIPIEKIIEEVEKSF